MFISGRRYAELKTQSCRLSRSRSQSKFTSLSLALRVHFISLLPLKGFLLKFNQMFSSQRRCAEPIAQPCRPKTTVTIVGHVFEPCILCPLHISFTPETLFIKLWTNVYLSATVCGTHTSTMQTQGKGHNLKVTSLSLAFRVHSFLLYPWKDSH